MPVEEKRGCGYRKVHGLYLMGSGLEVVCDRLPFLLKECDCCGFVPHMFRGFTWINKRYLGNHNEEIEKLRLAWVTDEVGRGIKDCSCHCHCPICYPRSNLQKRYGFMWVGGYAYTPESFIEEAKRLEVSKRITYMPKDLKIGDWILLAHKKAGHNQKPAIFYAFKLNRIEYLIWESEATPEYLEELKKKGLIPVIIPDGDQDHKAVAIKK